MRFGGVMYVPWSSLGDRTYRLDMLADDCGFVMMQRRAPPFFVHTVVDWADINDVFLWRVVSR